MKNASWEKFKKSKYVKKLEEHYGRSLEKGESIGWKNSEDARKALGNDKVSKAFIDFLYGEY